MSTFSFANVTDGNLLLKERTHTINSKIQLHILCVSLNKLGNWLMSEVLTVQSCYHNFPMFVQPQLWRPRPKHLKTKP